MTSQAEERTWIHMGGYGRLRGECVNQKTYKSSLPIFSPDFASNSQIRPFFNAEKKIFLKMLGTLLKTKFNRLFFVLTEWFQILKRIHNFFGTNFSRKVLFVGKTTRRPFWTVSWTLTFLSTAALLTQLIFSVEVEVSPIRIVNEVRSKVRFAPSCFFAITVVP